MFLRIETILPKKLIGFSTPTTLADDKTFFIWNKLMPRLKETKNLVSADLYSVQIYNFDSFQNFSPATEFTKCAFVEVKNFDFVPKQFETFELPAGEYAVFLHKGTSEDFAKTSQYIFAEWLPNSEFELDDRPHFAVMRDLYFGHENPNSQEEIWIPIK
ncbi:MAG: GyrI-like domain-containing protein [Flavobacteriaceae bacterium]|nr:GyrI-like domain-containing protein [Flavobacteriaceae bacterium]